ncbi:hypothetical protein EDEG_03748 [Edhazardia aedis USNM 41457]|uniref:Uncharacterized protein n=1 Tax=Edhazardia aedis (strain USNM 41457) TaxID=1003232 RepID=J9DK44_EDHAE|nr:hypothetical protein EDEG_03748 [Edhazardia aedis USNM 41457]|eukprot:EJW01732.1 hypothetical protein EDEG_03748 [Edhazardia aedis USNM 41457]
MVEENLKKVKLGFTPSPAIYYEDNSNFFPILLSIQEKTDFVNEFVRLNYLNKENKKLENSYFKYLNLWKKLIDKEYKNFLPKDNESAANEDVKIDSEEKLKTQKDKIKPETINNEDEIKQKICTESESMSEKINYDNEKEVEEKTETEKGTYQDDVNAKKETDTEDDKKTSSDKKHKKKNKNESLIKQQNLEIKNNFDKAIKIMAEIEEYKINDNDICSKLHCKVYDRTFINKFSESYNTLNSKINEINVNKRKQKYQEELEKIKQDQKNAKQKENKDVKDIEEDEDNEKNNKSDQKTDKDKEKTEIPSKKPTSFKDRIFNFAQEMTSKPSIKKEDISVDQKESDHKKPEKESIRSDL